MSIDKNPYGDGYRVRRRVNGKRLSRVVRTLRQAEALERKWIDEQTARRVGLSVEREPIVWDELCERYLYQHQVSPRTIRTLTERLACSRAAFGPIEVRQLRAEEIGRWLAALAVGDTTKANALRAMRQVCKAGVEWAYLSANPAKAVRPPKTPPTDVRPFESWAEVDALAAAVEAIAGINARALVLLVCATGLRPQEWQALTWQALDFSNRTCRVLHVVRGGRIEAAAKTDGSLRTIRLQQRALDALRAIPRPIDSRALVFPAPEGGIVNLSNFRRRAWQPALDAARLERRPLYQMRHTFATLGLSAGVPIEWISKQLGHADIRITLKHYARFLPAADERALRLLDAFAADQGGRMEDAREHE
jgi:integrase